MPFLQDQHSISTTKDRPSKVLNSSAFLVTLKTAKILHDCLTYGYIK